MGEGSVGFGAGFGRRPQPPTAAAPVSLAPLGLPWLIGLVVIPLLIAAIGYGAFDRPRSGSRPSGAAADAGAVEQARRAEVVLGAAFN